MNDISKEKKKLFLSLNNEIIPSQNNQRIYFNNSNIYKQQLPEQIFSLYESNNRKKNINKSQNNNTYMKQTNNNWSQNNNNRNINLMDNISGNEMYNNIYIIIKQMPNNNMNQINNDNKFSNQKNELLQGEKLMSVIIYSSDQKFILQLFAKTLIYFQV